MRTVGIIGGLGPSTTAEFYLEIVSGCKKADPTARPPVLTWSIPLSYQLEADVLTNGSGISRYVPYLQDAARILERGGAHFLVIPCNTVHLLINEVRDATNRPVLSIIEVTADHLVRERVREVGVLATGVTREQDLYGSTLLEHGIRTVYPNDEHQLAIGQIIRKITTAQTSLEEASRFWEVVQALEAKGLEHILLGCTDLQHLVRGRTPDATLHDTMRLLADRAVQEILGE